MHKVVEEFNVGERNLFILTLNEQMPHGRFTHCRIDGKEYKIYFIHYCRGSAEKMLDAMAKNIGIQEPNGGSFVGKEVEFV